MTARNNYGDHQNLKVNQRRDGRKTIYKEEEAKVFVDNLVNKK